MKQYSQKFLQLLESENKEEAVAYALQLLKDNRLELVRLYSDVLAPALNNMQCLLDDKDICVWKEHVRTAIVRTIVECCYPYVIAEREKHHATKKGTAIIICPPGEYHDLGARMIADYFTLCGYHAVFVGSNTPYADFYNAADKIKPDIIAISVSNYYNLVVTKKIIADLRKKMSDTTKIVVGGYAFAGNHSNAATVGADLYAETFADIRKIAVAQKGETT